MIDLTSTSDEDTQNAEAAYDFDKENIKPITKRSFTNMSADEMMPNFSRKLPANEEEAFDQNIGTNRYASLKKANPFFTYEELMDVTYRCNEMKTIQFCQQHGLIAKEQVCENCGSSITKPWFEKSRNQWWWACDKKPKGKKPWHSFKFSIKKGTFFEHSHRGMYQVLWLVWHFVNNSSLVNNSWTLVDITTTQS